MVSYKQYEQYLNTLSGEIPPDAWFIGGKMRDYHRELGQYGTALRTFDVNTFAERFDAWKRRELKRNKIVNQ